MACITDFAKAASRSECNSSEFICSCDASSNVIFHDVSTLTEKLFPIVEAMQKHFSAGTGTYYSDSIFFLSVALHRIIPKDISRIIQLDLDLKFKTNIRELFEEFDNFLQNSVIGIANEMQPVYRLEAVLYNWDFITWREKTGRQSPKLFKNLSQLTFGLINCFLPKTSPVLCLPPAEEEIGQGEHTRRLYLPGLYYFRLYRARCRAVNGAHLCTSWEVLAVEHSYRKLVPRGLRPDNLLPDKVKTEEQIAEWNSILLECSAKIMQFLIQLEQQSLDKTNGELDIEIKKIRTFDKEPSFLAMESKLSKNSENFKRNIRQKKHYKLQRDYRDFQEGNIFKNKNKRRFNINKAHNKGFSSSDETEWSESESRPRYQKRQNTRFTQHTPSGQTKGILRNTDRNITFTDPPVDSIATTNSRHESIAGPIQSPLTFLDQDWPQPQRERLRDRNRWGYKTQKSKYQQL
ncbi:xyloside xylosyltransferase 1 [Pelobates cultripes]|uniref:Xyloside xylosyltransferase 1 n=1 Tax=Pelobates cultripes TaxID=61616 RepID=A0AAD1REG0_PELCU|nr:xyloside xylosyltransferase 1 [Pelobates cultripes]